jgi:hypothetical protein
MQHIQYLSRINPNAAKIATAGALAAVGVVFNRKIQLKTGGG